MNDETTEEKVIPTTPEVSEDETKEETSSTEETKEDSDTKPESESEKPDEDAQAAQVETETRTGIVAPDEVDEKKEKAESEAAEKTEVSRKEMYGKICEGLDGFAEELKELFTTGYASTGLREAIRLLAEAEKVVRSELHRS